MTALRVLPMLKGSDFKFVFRLLISVLECQLSR